MMAKHNIFKLAVLFAISFFSPSVEGFFSDPQRKLIKSIIADFNVKNLMIVKSFSEEFPVDILVFKECSRGRIYGSFLTPDELNYVMYRDFFYKPLSKKFEALTDVMLNLKMHVATSKTIVVFNRCEGLKETMKLLSMKNHEFGLSRYIWLIFDNFNDSLVNYLKDEYIPYNVQFIVVKKIKEESEFYELHEVYHTRIYSGDFQEIFYGHWVDEKLNTLKIDFYQRRFDMNKTILSYGVDFPEDIECWRETCPFVEFLNETARMMNIQWVRTFQWKEALDYIHLSRYLFLELTLELYLGQLSITYANPLGDWIGPFWKKPAKDFVCSGGEIYSNIYSGIPGKPLWYKRKFFGTKHYSRSTKNGINKITIAQRGGANFKSYLYISLDESYVEYGISPYSKPFTFNFWLLVIGWVLLTGIFLIAIDVIKSKVHSKPISFTRFIYAFYHTYEILVSQVGEEFTVNLHFQVISLTAQLVALFVVPAYTGDILSFILVHNIELPFNGIEEFVKDGSYELLTQFQQQSFRLAKNDYWLSKALSFVAKNNEELHDIVDKLNFLCRNHKYAYFTFEDPDLLEFENCSILKIQNPVFIAWDVIFTRLDSPYKEVFNRIIKTMGSNGMLSKFRREVFENFAYVKPDSDNFEAVNLDCILPLVSVVGILFTLAILLLIAEYFSNKRTELRKSMFFRRKRAGES